MKRLTVLLAVLLMGAMATSASAAPNPFYNYDANGDGYVYTDDAQTVINFLNTVPRPPYNLFIDVNLDGYNSPIDALLIINLLNTKPWRNPSNAFDVNNDTYVSPIDALLIINRLNLGLGGKFKITQACVAPYYDVDGSNFLDTNDALAVINRLNGR